MLKMSKAYKQMMAEAFKGQAYMQVSIGVINQDAQKNAYVGGSTKDAPADCHYLSGTRLLFDDYDVELEYATYENRWWKLDGSMAFPPQEGTVDYLYNQGAISVDINGPLYIRYDRAYDIRGLSIDFSRNYPVSFDVYGYREGIEQGHISINDNDKSYWTTDYIFFQVDCIKLVPSTMSGGYDRLRIQKILMGVGINFDSKRITKASHTEFVSLISEELPTSDFTLSHRELW